MTPPSAGWAADQKLTHFKVAAQGDCAIQCAIVCHLLPYTYSYLQQPQQKQQQQQHQQQQTHQQPQTQTQDAFDAASISVSAPSVAVAPVHAYPALPSAPAPFRSACHRLAGVDVADAMIDAMYTLLHAYYLSDSAEQQQRMLSSGSSLDHVMDRFVMLVRERIARVFLACPDLFSYVDRLVPASSDGSIPSHRETADEHIIALTTQYKFTDGLDITAFCLDHKVHIRVVGSNHIQTYQHNAHTREWFPAPLSDDAVAAAIAEPPPAPVCYWTWVHHGNHFSVILPTCLIPTSIRPRHGPMPHAAPRPVPLVVAPIPPSAAALAAAPTPAHRIEETRARLPIRPSQVFDHEVDDTCLEVAMDLDMTGIRIPTASAGMSNMLLALVTRIHNTAATHNKQISLRPHPLPGLIRLTLPFKQKRSATDTTTNTAYMQFDTAASCAAACAKLRDI